jgi:hypothetical protein
MLALAVISITVIIAISIVATVWIVLGLIFMHNGSMFIPDHDIEEEHLF